MRDTIELLALLDNPNVRAFLAVIRAGEGTADEDGYRRHFGGRLFDNFDAHPNVKITAGLGKNQYTSTAAGAYQFLAGTWRSVAARYGLEDFAPATQDIAAVALIEGRKALDDVIAGRFVAAVAKCAPEWASLPGSPYGQPTKTLDQAKATYLAHGGQMAPALPAPHHIPETPAAADPGPSAPIPQEPAMVAPLVPLIAGLATSLINAFAPLAREKIQKEMARHTDNSEVAQQIAGGVIEAAKAVTGMADPIEAVVAVRADPELVMQVQQTTIDDMERLAPMLDKLAELDAADFAASEASRDAAAVRAKGEDFDMAKPLLFAAFVVLGLLILLVGVIVSVQVYKDGAPDTATWSALTGLIGWATGIGTMMYAYRFGTTRSSGAKDVVISQLANKQ